MIHQVMQVSHVTNDGSGRTGCTHSSQWPGHLVTLLSPARNEHFCMILRKRKRKLNAQGVLKG